MRRDAERIADREFATFGAIPAVEAQRDVLATEHRAAAALVTTLKALIETLPTRRAAVEAEIKQIEAQREVVAATVLLGLRPVKDDDDLSYRLGKLGRGLERIDAGKRGLECDLHARWAHVGTLARIAEDVDDELARERFDQKILLVERAR